MVRHSTEHDYFWAMRWTGSVFSIDSVDSWLWFAFRSDSLNCSIASFLTWNKGSLNNPFVERLKIRLVLYFTTLSVSVQIRKHLNFEHFKQNATRKFSTKRILPPHWHFLVKFISNPVYFMGTCDSFLTFCGQHWPLFMRRINNSKRKSSMKEKKTKKIVLQPRLNGSYLSVTL